MLSGHGATFAGYFSQSCTYLTTMRLIASRPGWILVADDFMK